MGDGLKKAQNSEGSPKEPESTQPEKSQDSSKDKDSNKSTGSTELNGLYAIKLGMSSVYNASGTMIPATVLRFDTPVISQIKSKENDGYSAVQIVFGKKSNLNKPMSGHLKKASVDKTARFAREIRCEISDDCKPGNLVSIESLKKGDVIKVTSKSKGRGFAGTVKRFGFGGGPASHGSKSHRGPGSIGMCEEPGRVLPGRKMPGRFGGKTVTIKRSEVLEVLPEKNILLIKGGVPGSRNTLVKLEKV